MSEISERKAEIRKEQLAQRHRLSAERMEWAGSEVLKFLKKGLSWIQFHHVGLYRPLGGEVPTGPLEGWLRGAEKVLYFPRADPESLMIDLVKMGPGDAWVRSPLSILEPAPHLTPVNPEKLDLILVPGLAFDRSGRRVGRGKGCYDRWLRGFGGTRVGLAYEFQILDQVPAGPQDEPVHYLVTEGSFFEVPKKT